jgi:RNA polymerase sigma factor (sigma-70 family)
MRKFKMSKKYRGTYVYRFVDNTIFEIKVNDDVTPQDITFLYQLDDEEVDRDRREQYHVPYFYDEISAQEEDNENWKFPTILDERTPLSALLEQENSKEREQLFVKLNRAIKELTEKQELTIKKIFYEGMNNSELAREEGISETAIRHRLIKIYANLRKNIC